MFIVMNAVFTFSPDPRQYPVLEPGCCLSGCVVRSQISLREARADSELSTTRLGICCCPGPWPQTRAPGLSPQPATCHKADLDTQAARHR